MRFIWILPLILVSLCFAETSIPDSMLTDAQKSYLQAKQIQQEVATTVAAAQIVKESVQAAGSTTQSWGTEVGTAVKQTLDAVGDFATTPAGQFLLALVAFKVIGETAIGIVFGIPILLLVTLLWVWIYRKNCMARPIVTEQTGWGPWTKTIKRTWLLPADPKGKVDVSLDGSPTYVTELGFSRFWHTVPYCVFVCVMLIIIF